MGLGKTFVGSEKLWELNAPYNLVICQKSQINDWVKHFKNYYPEYEVVKYTNQSEFKEDVIYIVNYETAWRRPQLRKMQHYTLMLDESSKIKNEKSKVTKFILSLNPENVILLSGTPTGGKYEELYSQLKLLGWDINYWHYMNKYVVMLKYKHFKGFKVVGYKNVDDLKQQLRDHGAVFMKTEEAFELPEQQEVFIDCKKTKDYEHFNEHHYLKLKDRELVGDTVLNRRLYIRQLAGHLNPNKIERLRDLLESTEDRILIFYNWTEEYEIIKSICKQLNKPVSVIKGGLVDKENYETKSNSVTLIQYMAGAMGHNLQKSNKIVYFTLPDKSLLFEQSKKRTHRIGQERTCFYYYLMTENSIEQKILNTLKMRKDLTDELFKEE